MKIVYATKNECVVEFRRGRGSISIYNYGRYYAPSGEFLEGGKDPKTGLESLEGLKNEFGLDRGLSLLDWSEDALAALGMLGGAQKFSKLDRGGFECSCDGIDCGCCWSRELG